MKIALACVLFLAGCASIQPDSRDFGYLTLKQMLTVRPDEATIRLQFGQVVARNAVQEQEPYCIFEVDPVAQAPLPVAPAAYRITAVSQRVETFSGMPVAPAVFAAFGRDRPSQIYYITRFRLDSPTRPKARSLTCQINAADAGFAYGRHLTMAEMQAALGCYFSLDVPAAR